MENYVIDATNRTVGEVASEAATVLRGKNKPSFSPSKLPQVSVTINNASKVKITGNKIDQKKLKTFSGYPSGLKEATLKKVSEKKGYSEILTHAVRGMLPNNKLRKPALLRLTITE